MLLRFSDQDDDSLDAPDVSKEVVEKNLEEKSETANTSSKPEDEPSGKCSDKQTDVVEEVKDDTGKSGDFKIEKRKPRKTSSSFKEKNEKFQYGNYNQYYGYR